jgi:hypothetical protein
MQHIILSLIINVGRSRVVLFLSDFKQNGNALTISVKIANMKFHENLSVRVALIHADG